MKLKYIDLFAGCGGLSLGLKSSRKWEGVFAIEKNTDAFETLKHNLIDKGSHFKWPRDIPCRNMDIEEILSDFKKNIGINYKNIDLVAGGPPCQGFSTNGKRNEGDARNKLIASYIKFIRLVQPKIILFENVKGFTKQFDRNKIEGKKYSDFVQGELGISCGDDTFCGYHVRGRLIDFGKFGIPQRRVRYILVGVRKDMGKESAPDIIFDYLIKGVRKFLLRKGISPDVNLSEAISDLLQGDTIVCPDSPKFKSGIYKDCKSGYQKLMRKGIVGNSPDSHRFVNHKKETISKFRYILDNSKRNKTVSNDVKSLFKISKRTIVPLDGTKKAMTITTLPDDYVHYSQPRVLTVREYARIQSFPDSYEFKGKYTTGGKQRVQEVPRYSQVGNAIPPLFGEQIGIAISKYLCNVR